MKFDLLIQGGKLVIPKQGIGLEPLSLPSRIPT